MAAHDPSEWKLDEKYEKSFQHARGVSSGKKMWCFDTKTDAPVQVMIQGVCKKPKRNKGEDKWAGTWDVRYKSEDGEEYLYETPYWALFTSKNACSRYWNPKDQK